MRDDAMTIPGAPPGADVTEMAVRLILTREVSPTHLARDLGIGPSTISRWVRDAIAESPYGGVLERLHEEVGTLRKENAALQRVLAGRNAKSGAGGAVRHKLD